MLVRSLGVFVHMTEIFVKPPTKQGINSLVRKYFFNICLIVSNISLDLWLINLVENSNTFNSFMSMFWKQTRKIPERFPPKMPELDAIGPIISIADQCTVPRCLMSRVLCLLLPNHKNVNSTAENENRRKYKREFCQQNCFVYIYKHNILLMYMKILLTSNNATCDESYDIRMQAAFISCLCYK